MLAMAKMLYESWAEIVYLECLKLDTAGSSVKSQPYKNRRKNDTPSQVKESSLNFNTFFRIMDLRTKLVWYLQIGILTMS